MSERPLPLSGLVILSFESRRAAEMAELIRRHGGEPVSAPSMREVPIRQNPEAIDLLHALQRNAIDVVVLLTGVGTRTLVRSIADECPPERFADLLRRTTIVARGPKPVAALREIGLTPNVTAPEPNTWRELLQAVDEQVPLAGRSVAVQEYGRTNPALVDALVERAAEVRRVPVYHWDLPEDVAPLRSGIQRFAAGDVDAVLFTSARQVDHVMRVAEDLGLAEDLLGAAGRAVVASIGPVCSEALAEQGWPVDIEPEHPKMGHLVNAIAKRCREVLARKRSAARPDLP